MKYSEPLLVDLKKSCIDAQLEAVEQGKYSKYSKSAALSLCYRRSIQFL